MAGPLGYLGIQSSPVPSARGVVGDETDRTGAQNLMVDCPHDTSRALALDLGNSPHKCPLGTSDPGVIKTATQHREEEHEVSSPARPRRHSPDREQ
jgi:hypothetical protein